MSKNFESEQLRREWAEHSRWDGIERPYSAEDVFKRRGSVRIEYSLARLGAQKFWRLLRSEEVVSALGACTVRYRAPAGADSAMAVVNSDGQLLHRARGR